MGSEQEREQEREREPSSVSTLTSRSILTEVASALPLPLPLARSASVTSGAVGGAPDELAFSSGVAATFVPVPRRVEVFVRNDNEAAGMHVARTHRALGIPRVEKAMHRLAATIGLECTAIDVDWKRKKV